MKILIKFIALLFIGTGSLLAQELPEHCNGNNIFRDNLQSLGPVIAVGASGSSGLWATPFPDLVANQMCLNEGAGFESRYSIFFFGSKISFLKKMYIEQRPKIVIAIDHLHHSSKSKRFNAVTREYIDRELARISLDCRHEIVDCSPEGEFHFVEKEKYRPTVLLGDIFAFYAVDCSKSNPFEGNNGRKKVEDRNIGCIDDYIKINRYMWQKASEIPNLHIMPVNDLFKHLHRGLPYLYQLDGKLGNFFKDDIFWDGFHPWSEPGAQVMANIVLEKVNELIEGGLIQGFEAVPYIPIKDKYFKPFTGIVFIDDTNAGIAPGIKLNFVSKLGRDFSFDFDDKSTLLKDEHGDRGITEVFDIETDNLISIVGDNPAVITFKVLSENGDIILSVDQMALIRKLSEASEKRILSGVVTRVE